MEIIKSAGEQDSPALHQRIAAELRPVLAVRGSGAALWAGTRLLVSRGWTILGQYLTGWEKPAALAFAGYVLAHSASRYPTVTQFAVPAATVAWCVVAWWVAPSAGRDEETEASPVEAEQPREQLSAAVLAEVVRRAAGTRQGAHLAQLLDEPEFDGWEQSDLKADVVRLGVPVKEFKLILSGRQRVRDGVRVRDLPLPAAPDGALVAPSGGSTESAPRPDSDPAPGAE